MARTVTIGGEERELRFTLRSLRFLEESTEHKITDPDFEVWASSAAGLGALLYAGLLHDGKDQTVDSLEDKIGIEDIVPLVRQVLDAFSESLPSPNGQSASQKRSVPKTRRLTGTSSGQ